MKIARIKDYELSTYEYGYMIERVGVVPETNPQGKPNKNAGKEARTGRMYFGRVDHAVSKLAELLAAEMHDVDGLRDWLAAFRAAADHIIEKLEAAE